MSEEISFVGFDSLASFGLASVLSLAPLTFAAALVVSLEAFWGFVATASALSFFAGFDAGSSAVTGFGFLVFLTATGVASSVAVDLVNIWVK